jgi:hypothetical protein
MFGGRPRLPAFIPVAVVENAASVSARPASGVIEIEFAGGTRLRITGAVEPTALATVVAALMKPPA